MNSLLVEKKNSLQKEEGFSLIEIMIGIVVIGILVGIAVPLWINSQNEVNAQKTKAAMQTAGLLLEQEAVDNNGLYPTYVPSEIKDNPESAGFIYSYDDSRTSWCLQGNSTVGRIYTDSTRGGKVDSNFCVESNIATNSDTPWQAPTVSVPAAPVITSHTWASNEPAAKTTLTATPPTCNLSADDQANWDTKKSLYYKFTATNNNPARNESTSTSWLPNPTATMTLTGWLPGDTVEYKVEAKCVITNDTTDFGYPSGKSAGVSRAIVTFAVAPTTFVTTSAAWTSASNFRTSATWTASYCPSGVKQSLLSIKDNTTGSTANGSTVWNVSDRTSATIDNSTWTSGGTTTFTHTVGCKLSDGRVITSPASTATASNTLRPPSTPTGLMTVTDSASSNAATPTSLKWNAVTCAAGSPQYYVTGTTPTAWNSGWITSVSIPLNLTPLQTYTYNVMAKCVNGATSSISSPVSTNVSFTAQYATPKAPSAVTGVTTTALTTSFVKTGHTITWNASTCGTGSTISYQVIRTMIDNQDVGSANYKYYGWQTGTTFNIPSTDLKFGSYIGFTVASRCSNQAGATNGANSALVKAQLGVAKPTNPPRVNRFWSNGAGAIEINPGATCGADAEARYTVEELSVSTGKKTGVYYQKDSPSRIVNIPNQGGGGFTNAAFFTIQCAGANYQSGTAGYSYAYWTMNTEIGWQTISNRFLEVAQ